MELDIEGLARKPASERKQWFRFKADAELLLRFASAAEQAEHMGAAMSVRRGNLRIDDAKSRDYWCAHVEDWRGITKGGEPLPCTQALVRQYYDLDVDFRQWLVERCQDIDGFRESSSAA